MIKLENVTFGYGEAPTLKNISLEINDGDFIAIVGSNGAGKSTISRIIRGLIRADSGKITIDGQNIDGLKTSSLAKKIGFLFQNPDRQICKSTVRDELMFGLENTVGDKKRRMELCEKALEDFMLDGDKDPFGLSRGERQRVALASVIAGEPEVLILDEPTTGLDYLECVSIMEKVKLLNGNGTTVIMVCHDMELVLDYARRTVVMTDGRIIADGATSDIFYNRGILEQASLLAPQIIGLSELLDEKYGRVTAVDELAEAIITRISDEGEQ